MSSHYTKTLSKDKVLGQIIQKQGSLEPLQQKSINHCLYLCRSIIAQQLSTRVAQIINNRFLLLLHKKRPSAKDIVSLHIEELRSIGLSASKANYILAVGTFFLAQPKLEKMLHKMNEDDIFRTLTEIKGIGRWTVEMYLIFQLGRENIFSSSDLGIQKSMIKHYQLKNDLPKKKLIEKMESLAEKWSPYKSYACLHLWKALDEKK